MDLLTEAWFARMMKPPKSVLLFPLWLGVYIPFLFALVLIVLIVGTPVVMIYDFFKGGRYG